MANRLTSGLRSRRLPGLLVLLMAGLAAAPGSRAETFDALHARIEEGYRDRNLDSLDAARAELLVLADTQSADPDEATRAAYYAAYARFRQALAADTAGSRARGYLEDCIGELRLLVERAPDHAEARALLGSCYGMSTLHDVLATMTRGLEARRQMAEARRLAPDNPWVVMQDGLADWATPRLFGGDRSLALAKLERAAGLFTTAMQSGSRTAAWGAAEAWHQLGLRYEELGRKADAEAAFGRARSVASGPVRLAATRS